MNNKKKVRVGKILLYVVLSLGAITMILPFTWTILSSLKNMGQTFASPPKILPDPIVWENYPDSLATLPFGRAYFNSFYIAFVVVVIQLLTATMAGYAFAKLKFHGSNFVFILFLATMMIPSQVTMIPLFIIMKYLGLLGTHLSLILPAGLFNAFGVFLMRQFIAGIPNELEEAAVIDGATVPQIFFRIIIQLVKPSMAAFGIFVFLGQWNNFLYPLIFLNKTETFTVPLLLNFFKGTYATNYPLLMAGTVISILPVLIVYMFFQKQIIQGIAITGMKN
ncbi:carbohydrate ABC transporter permease [Anaerocolumna sp. MB42-C2]|uniref:carbohydrate ABC transporter permease n=1 Tax=Anaerocolumna sp. MB42-C2 TaxID=3070997 RepID=UPI0027E17AF7|nr:carbohydrate ABC transporter permease [Anaerocolumna sp. MB42-C2]WMJ90416.1 carbohydrate ABC transporter permease [Anaerocolumna sp. MB42-C2]